MATRAQLRWSVLAVVIAATAVVGVGSGQAASAFPCRWNWSLFDGMRPGYVTAGSNADCTGRRGSLTLSIRVQKQDPATMAWQTVKARHKTFRHLNGNRGLDAATPCVAATFRGIFRWTLRDAGGAVVARHRVKSGKLVVTGPNCAITLGGPGTPLRPAV
jgi:hypothetical protein